MQSFGAVPVDFKHPLMQPGDALVIPAQNASQHPPDPRKTTLVEFFTTPASAWFATYSGDIGASFYASIFGPLPFAFGGVPPDTVFVYISKQSADDPH
jgi:hypothetical protein